MRIIDLLSPKGIDLNVKVSTKEQAIDKLVSLMDATGKISDIAVYKAAVKKREEEGTTAMGEGGSHSPRQNQCSKGARSGGHAGAGRL